MLAISLLLTGVVWSIADRLVRDAANTRFEIEISDIRIAIAKRMLDQELALRGGVGLFSASSEVTRKEWQRYANALDLAENFPGLQGFGFSRVIPPVELASFTDRIRAEGFSDFSVRPEGQRAIYTAIEFLEPFDWRNQRAFGYDMFSQETRREAMERARDTGSAAVSGAVTLVQETDTDVQRGFLMYLPVYRKGQPIDTTEKRTAALLGYVYSPFRMNDLMEGILEDGRRNISFEVWDGPAQQDELPLYVSDNGGHGTRTRPESSMRDELTLEIGGRSWELNFTAHPTYISGAEKNQPVLIVAAGILFDILVFLVISMVSRQRSKAITVANQMSEQLNNQNVRTKVILETMVDGVVTIDERGDVNSFNPAASNIFGYQPDEVIGKNVSMLMPLPDRGAQDGYLADYRQTGIGAIIGMGREVEGLRKDGSMVPIELSVSPMEIDGQRMFTGLLRDISERRQMDRLKNEFVSIASHELRTPITALVSSIEIVQTGALGNVPEEASEMLELARRNGQRLSLLINDILDMDKIECGEMSFNREKVEIVSLVSSSIAENIPFAAKLGVTLQLESAMDEAWVMADGDRIGQVLSNLLSNAAKFSPAESVVSIQVLRQPKGIRISVTDHGPGIPEEMQSAVFDKFRQLDSTDSRGKLGSGLGLSIAQSIIMRHDSNIRIKSEVGFGSKFYFDLHELTIDQGGLPDETYAGSPIETAA